MFLFTAFILYTVYSLHELIFPMALAASEEATVAYERAVDRLKNTHINIIHTKGTTRQPSTNSTHLSYNMLLLLFYRCQSIAKYRNSSVFVFHDRYLARCRIFPNVVNILHEIRMRCYFNILSVPGRLVEGVVNDFFPHTNSFHVNDHMRSRRYYYLSFIHRRASRCIQNCYFQWAL